MLSVVCRACPGCRTGICGSLFMCCRQIKALADILSSCHAGISGIHKLDWRAPACCDHLPRLGWYVLSLHSLQSPCKSFCYLVFRCLRECGDENNRPAGISNYERWRAHLLAAEGYIGAQLAPSLAQASMLTVSKDLSYIFTHHAAVGNIEVPLHKLPGTLLCELAAHCTPIPGSHEA